MAKRRNKPEKLRLTGFLNELANVHHNVNDRGLAFILGAGASVSSGIPSGGKLVEDWLNILRERQGSKDDLSKWATAENVEIKEFEYHRAAEFYPQVFERCYRQDPDIGYAYLENKMEGKEPGLGYAALASILANTENRTVITTNFDNLVADALAIYSRTHPLIVSHESLAPFVSSRPRRPLIAKIHRDLMLEPYNDPDNTSRLATDWKPALSKVFENHTPLVVGYGGNDGSLMDFLENLDSTQVKGCFYWCLYKDHQPSQRIEAVMNRHGGYYTSINDFDEFMLALASRLLGGDFNVAKLAKDIEEHAKKRAAHFRDTAEKFQKVAHKKAETEQLTKPAFEPAVKDRKDWWSWQLAINALDDLEQQKQLYEQAISELPESHQLIGNFASFLHGIRKEYNQAETLYQRALELDPDDANNTGNFAIFLKNIRKDYDQTEALYQKALELDPDSVNNMGNFANFLTDIRKDHDQAEALYRKALELDPEDADHTGNFALFLYEIRKDYDQAESLYKKALELDPQHANNTGNFANFLSHIRKDYDQAESLYKKALELDPDSANKTGNFGNFLLTRNRLSQAFDLIQQSWHLNQFEADQLAGELLVGLAAIAMKTGISPSPCFAGLKMLLNRGYIRESWQFDSLYEWAEQHLENDQATQLRLIGGAVVDEAALPALEEAEWWQKIKPMPFEKLVITRPKALDLPSSE